MMGVAASSTNITFHLPTIGIERLSQRIADLNLLLKPDLCIADATEFISTNGSYGSGKILAPKKIVVLTSPCHGSIICIGTEHF